MRKTLNEAAIRALASDASFARGRAYRDDGAVASLVRRGDTVTAEVAGSGIEPYRVTVRIAGGAVAEARCTCAYEWGGACKHIVATLLSVIEAPAAIAERPTLDDLLRRLDREALAALLLKRAAFDPDLAGWIESELAVRPGQGAAPDPAPVAARARAVLAERDRHRDYWDGYRAAGDAGELRDLVEKAVPLMEAGDGHGALRVLEAVTDAFVDDWIDEASGTDEHLYALFDDLARMMAEAALMSDLGEDERAALAETAEDWQDRLADYGVEEGFDLVAHALRTGWDAPGLQAVLAGGGGPWPPVVDEAALMDRAVPEGEDLDEADDELFDAVERESSLTEVRLRVLDAAGRHDAYLHLARAAGAHAATALMLVRLGRSDEAVAHARETFCAPGESLALAQALDRTGRAEEAFAVARSGLSLASPDLAAGWAGAATPLARWLRDTAAAAGRTDLALEAARAAFAGSLTPEDFRAAQGAAQGAAGKAWDGVRRDLLTVLDAAGPTRHRVEILLGEGLIDAAVAGAGDGTDHVTPDSVLLRLTEAAQGRHPDWVIRLARQRAEPIMDRGQADLYAEAAEWLRRAALAHESAGLIDEWSALIESLIERHRRKYKLRPMLEALRF